MAVTQSNEKIRQFFGGSQNATSPVYSRKRKWWQRISKELVTLSILTLLIYLLVVAVLSDSNKLPSTAFATYVPQFISNSIDKINLNTKEVVVTKVGPSKGVNYIASVESEEDYIIQAVAGDEKKVINKIWSSFGDGYSSAAYLDKERTSMYMDENVSALMFPPLYNLEFKNSCVDCQNRSDLVYLQSGDALSDLDFMPRPLPEDLMGKNILAASISKLDKKRVAAFVFKVGSEEQSYVYFIEGDKYIPIIGSQSKEKMLTTFSRGSGVVVAGGSDDDFIILYSGYEGIAYHYLKGKLYDISRFFKINTMGRGFPPYVVKQGTGKELAWYILSLDVRNNRLIKLWQNGTSHIQGVVDLSEELDKTLRGERIEAYNFSKNKQIEFILSNNTSKILLFEDNGFDNSQERVALSKNINDKKYPVHAAVIRAISMSLDSDENAFDNKFKENLVKIYLGDSPVNFQEVKIKEETEFAGDRTGMFIKMIFYPKADDSYYSPWLDSINDMGYLVSR